MITGLFSTVTFLFLSSPLAYRCTSSAFIPSLTFRQDHPTTSCSRMRPLPCTRCAGGKECADIGSEKNHRNKKKIASLPHRSHAPSWYGIESSVFSRRRLLAEGSRAIAVALGVTAGAATGLSQGVGEGIRPAKAFGGPTRPLLRCLVNAINAREFSRRLEADLASGVNTQECRGLVKAILRGLDLQACLKDAVLYLPAGKRQAATDAGQSSVEYLATVVEFDAWDKLDKDWTSNVALRNMTPDNVNFVRMALGAAASSLDQYLLQFDRADVQNARETYRSMNASVEDQEPDDVST